MRYKIKLLHITSSLKIGGAESLLCDMIRILGHTEFEHHVIYFYHGPNVQKIKDIGAQVYRIKGLASLYDPVFFAKLFFLVKKINPDLIHSLLWSANISSRIVSKLLHIPNISAYHLDIYNDGIFRKCIDKATRKMSDCVVAVADNVARSLGDERSYKKLEIIENGIDFHEIHKNAKKNKLDRQAIGLHSGNFIIGSVGRLHPQKNFPLLLKSFAQISCIIPDARLIILGVGELESDLKKMAKILDIEQKVKFIIGKRACDYYRLFDCFVQSSLKEGLSIALLEAMSFELPCIVTNVLSSTESKSKLHPVITHNENGLIVESGNEGMLRDAILSIITNKKLAKKLGINAQKSVLESYSIKTMINKYKKIFYDLTH